MKLGTSKPEMKLLDKIDYYIGDFKLDEYDSQEMEASMNMVHTQIISAVNSPITDRLLQYMLGNLPLG